jgi:ribosomal protein L1
MNEDTLNMEVRKYLKKVGVTSQREIEHAIQKAIESKMISGAETMDVKMTLNVPAIGLNYCIEGEIALE